MTSMAVLSDSREWFSRYSIAQFLSPLEIHSSRHDSHLCLSSLVLAMKVTSRLLSKVRTNLLASTGLSSHKPVMGSEPPKLCLSSSLRLK